MNRNPFVPESERVCEKCGHSGIGVRYTAVNTLSVSGPSREEFLLCTCKACSYEFEMVCKPGKVSILLTNAGSTPVAVIKAMRSHMKHLSLVDAKRMTDMASPTNPIFVAEFEDLKLGDQFAHDLRSVGATCKVR